jgi:hypothetical protein
MRRTRSEKEIDRQITSYAVRLTTSSRMTTREYFSYTTRMSNEYVIVPKSEINIAE